MMNDLIECPVSRLMLPRQFVDEKKALKKVIDDVIEKACSDYSYVKGVYYLTLHAKFDKMNPGTFNISPPTISYKLPRFISNTFVFWVCNRRGICELLWMISGKVSGQKLKVEFNTQGVAYLQAQGAMPK